jgi:NAD+ diphosphatase
LSENAFFFQGDTLLLPEDFPDSAINNGLPPELSKDFDKNSLDIFEIPALDTPSVIRAVSVADGTVLPSTWKGVPVRRVLTLLSGSGAAEGGALIRACHIAQWRRNSHYCGSCGTKNDDVSGEAQRICPVCGQAEFPRICPAVIVVITDEKDRILLAHNKKFRAGVYSLISGFSEAGETLESTVVREIREEVNIEVRDITYIKSQPWPFPNSLMIGFRARYLTGTIKPDGDEIEDAAWFSRDNLPELPAEGSLSRFLINSWLSGNLEPQ